MDTRLPEQPWHTGLFQPSHTLFAQVPRALIVSVIAAALDVAVLFLLVDMYHWQKVPAATVSYLLGGVVQYALCSLWVFPTAPRNVATGFLAFTVLSLVGLGITAGTMHVMAQMWHVNYKLAKVVALALSFCWNFGSRKYLLFQEQQQTHQLLDQ
jgi:putative flippase GtrA